MLTIVARLVPADPAFTSVLQKLAHDHDLESWSFTVPICTVPKHPVVNLAVGELHELQHVRDVIELLQTDPIIGFSGHIHLDSHGRYTCQVQEIGDFVTLKAAINRCLEFVFESLGAKNLAAHSMLSDQPMLVELKDKGELTLQMPPQWFVLEGIEIIDSAALTLAAA